MQLFWALPTFAFKAKVRRALHYNSSLVPRCGIFIAIPNATTYKIKFTIDV